MVFSTAAGFALYLFTLLLRPWNRLLLLVVVAGTALYFFGPYIAYHTEDYVRYANPLLAQERAGLWFGHTTMLVFGSSLALGSYGIWQRRTMPITLSQSRCEGKKGGCNSCYLSKRH